MAYSCQYLCSELVTVTYEEQPGRIRQGIANLEEISDRAAVVLLDDELSLGAPISLAIKDRDLYGTVVSRLFDALLGWYVTIQFDAASLWNRFLMAPRNLLN